MTGKRRIIYLCKCSEGLQLLDFTVLSLTLYRSYLVYWRTRHVEIMKLWEIILKDGEMIDVNDYCLIADPIRCRILSCDVFLESAERYILYGKSVRHNPPTMCILSELFQTLPVCYCYYLPDFVFTRLACHIGGAEVYQ